jgi:putative pyoverdin transport system ATP-binding/permease protein
MIGAGILSGLFSAGVLAVITRALHARGAPITIVVAFFVLVAGKIAASAGAQLLLVRFSQGSILELSLSLCSRILDSPLRLIERRGAAAILTVLTDDVSSVTWAVQCLPQLATNGAVVIGCGAYLAWLSFSMFLSAAGATLLGALVYTVLHRRAIRVIQAARDARASLFEHFRTVTSGTKELLMHRQRRAELVEVEIRGAAEAYRSSNLAAVKGYTLAGAWIQTLYHGLIGLLLFVSPLLTHPSVEQLTGYVFALLYMMAPLWDIISAVPALARGEVAFQRIEEIGRTEDLLQQRRAVVGTDCKRPQASASIEMSGVLFQYESADPAHEFTLGPIDFHIRSGELVFVVGGNGSGKTTFLKVLAGLYMPSAGSIALDGAHITPATLEWYREHFSVVFADCFVFGKLLGLGPASPELDAATHRYLRLLEIEHKVDVHGGVLTTTDLSQGQRRRLALVTAYLEDRPFYVFDEWAADQDPAYKEVFYTKLLPELRARGKGVIVITHDDRYFHLGDRIMKLADGRVTVSNEEGSSGVERAIHSVG